MQTSKDARAVIELTGKMARMEVQSAIKDDLIKSLRETVEHYRSAFYHEFTRNNRLTSETTSLKVGGTRDMGGINLPVKEER